MHIVIISDHTISYQCNHYNQQEGVHDFQFGKIEEQNEQNNCFLPLSGLVYGNMFKELDFDNLCKQ